MNSKIANRRRLTEAEWEVMEAIWSLGVASGVRDVLQHAYPAGEKTYTTVQTIMNNLVAKGFLREKKVGLVNFTDRLFLGKRQYGARCRTWWQRLSAVRSRRSPTISSTPTR